MKLEHERLYDFLREDRSYIPNFDQLSSKERLKLVNILSKLHRFCGEIYHVRQINETE